MRAKRQSNSLRSTVNPTRSCSPSLVVRFFTEEGAQDLIEYALLAAFIGIAGWAVLLTLTGVIGATYASWLDPTNGVPGQWDPPEPASAGS
jgi:Flp pilus assembly pilin Flp